jgi:hypothetical protein
MSIPAACLFRHESRRNRINPVALSIPYLSANFMRTKIAVAMATRSKDGNERRLRHTHSG